MNGAVVAGASGQEVPVVESSAEIVRLDVVVLDREGQPVSGLTAADFVVTDEGEPQEIRSFEAVEVAPSQHEPPSRLLDPVSAPQDPEVGEARHLLLFYDDLHISPASAARARQELERALATLRPDDWLTLVAPESGLWWHARSAGEHAETRRFVAGLGGMLDRDPFGDGASEVDALRWIEYGQKRVRSIGAGPPRAPGDGNGPPGRGGSARPTPTGTLYVVTLDPPPPQLQVTYAAAQNRLRRSLEALETAIAALVPFRGHKSLVMISEGFVLSPSVKEAYQRVTEAAQLARVAVYLVDPQGLTSGLPTASGGSATSATEREGQMGGTMEVVHATGGRQFSSNDLTLGIRQALRESEVYYLLGYPKPPGGKKKRDVRIRALGEGLEVLAPRRRYASDPAAMAERVAAAEDRVYDETGLPLQVRALAGAIDETGAVETTLAVAVGPSGATSPEAVTFTIEARREGRSLVRGELSQELPLSEGRSLVRLGFAFAPGLWQARVTASVRGGALRASALHTFEVAEGGPLRVSTPILSDVLDAEGEPRLRMDPVFSRQSPLYCGVRVWGVGGGAVSVRYVLRVEGGDRVEEGLLDTRPSGAGPLLASASWPPGTLASGRYLLEVRAAAEPEGLSSAVREVFEVR